MVEEMLGFCLTGAETFLFMKMQPWRGLGEVGERNPQTSHSRSKALSQEKAGHLMDRRTGNLAGVPWIREKAEHEVRGLIWSNSRVRSPKVLEVMESHWGFINAGDWGSDSDFRIISGCCVDTGSSQGGAAPSRDRCHCAGQSSCRLNQGGGGRCGWVWVLSEGSWQGLRVGCIQSVRERGIQGSPESWDSWLRNHSWLQFFIWKKKKEEKVRIGPMLVKWHPL